MRSETRLVKSCPHCKRRDFEIYLLMSSANWREGFPTLQGRKLGHRQEDRHDQQADSNLATIHQIHL